MGHAATRSSVPTPGAASSPQFRFEGTAGNRGHGPFFVISLTIDQDSIKAAQFETLGCMWSQRIGISLVSILACTSPERAMLLTEDELLRIVGEPPRHKRGLVTLALEALSLALGQWRMRHTPKVQ